MTSAPRLRPRSAAQGGFTLVELMVGMVLGLLTVLVITQVLALSEGKKRTISLGSDAQVNGSLALFTLQRDIQQAGYGISQFPSALGCEVRGQRTGAGAFSFILAPIVITRGADNDAPDQISVLQAQTTGSSTPIEVTGARSGEDTAFVVKSSFGATVGSMMVAVPKVQGSGTWCTLFNVTNDSSSQLTALGPTRIPTGAGDAGPWNHSSLYPSGGYGNGDALLNMGTVVRRTYGINAAYSLQVTEFDANSGTDGTQELYPQIVNLQAFYAKDTDGNGVVDRYDATMPTTNEGWKQVVAIRIALVARSNQYEKDEVTASDPLWDVGGSTTIADATTATCGTSTCIALKVSHLDQWKHYRYKVYDTIVPLRNVLWNS